MAENLPSTMPLAGELDYINKVKTFLGAGGSAAPIPFKAPKAALLTADELQNLMTLHGRQSGAFLQPVLNQRAAGIYGGSSAQLGVQAAQREIAAKVAELNMQQRAGNRDAQVQTDRTNATLAARGPSRTKKDAYEEMALATILASARNPNGFVNNLGETAWSGAKNFASSMGNPFASYNPGLSMENYALTGADVLSFAEMPAMTEADWTDLLGSTGGEGAVDPGTFNW